MTTKELTNGNPYKLILLFMLPIFIGNAFQQMYMLVDSLIVGRIIGLNALAAVGAASPLIFLIISFVFSSTQGFTIITAQKFGAKEFDLVKKSFAASIILSSLVALVLTLISTPFSYALLNFLRTPHDIINSSASYLVVMFAGIFATVFYNLASNTIRALGDSKTPLYFLILSSCINIVMDLLLIIKFNMGIKGAAYATVIAQALSTILCAGYMFAKFPVLCLKKQDWSLSKEFLYEHLRVGLPMGFQMSVMTIGIIAVQYVLNTFGTTAVASFTAATRIDMMFSQVFVALGATMAVFAAQNFGAKQIDRIKQGVKAGMMITIYLSLTIILLITMFSKYMILWFMSEINQEVVTLAQQYLYIIMFFYIFFGFLMVFRNVMQGTGNAIGPLFSGLCELFARIFCAIVLGNFLGYMGICIATPAAWVVGTILLYILFKISLNKQTHSLSN